MMREFLSKWQIKENISLKKFTTWNVGGPARYFYEADHLDSLQAMLKELPKDIPVFWLGLGSNLLVRDNGFDGLIISLRKGLQDLHLLNSCGVHAQAGVSCAKLARFAAKNNCQQGEFFAGIPGTVGGALAMNAGCWGGETWDLVDYVHTIDKHGQIHQRSKADFDISYREVIPHYSGEAFVAAAFKFIPGELNTAMAKIRELLDKRTYSQPTGEHSCGSVFRNPPGYHAAKLIEEAGLKGYKIGGAQISEKHANFIINSEEASSKDIEALIKHIIDTIKEKHGVTLKTEVKMIGAV